VGGIEHYVQMYENGKWNDIHFKNNDCHVCKYETAEVEINDQEYKLSQNNKRGGSTLVNLGNYLYLLFGQKGKEL